MANKTYLMSLEGDSGLRLSVLRKEFKAEENKEGLCKV